MIWKAASMCRFVMFLVVRLCVSPACFSCVFLEFWFFSCSAVAMIFVVRLLFKRKSLSDYLCVQICILPTIADGTKFVTH